ncbi:MAG: polyprenyl synthetase family protein [Candidatus Bathyarchaeota archaeon]|nr:polyprenyl synthetase family protein [Candidatus Bathyarchaeota archaeon]
MYEKNNVEESCRRILEDNGGAIADKARTILLEDPALRKDLREPLEFIAKNWRNPLTPAMMRLACEAVGGCPEETDEAALAMSLISLSLYIWDDMIDKARFKLFKPTLFGKFGEGTALVIGGLASAKAFTILNQMNIDKVKRQTITKLLWDFLVKMAQAETASLRLRKQKVLSAKKKFWKIKTEATDLETCLKIGAVLGNGSESEIQHLGRYGLCLGIILELRKDFHVSVNLTAGLAERIRSGILPYSLLWASERSEKIRSRLSNLPNKNSIKQTQIKEIVEDALETNVLDNTLKVIRRLTKKAKEELIELESNNATRTLQLFIEAQPSLFIRSLHTSQT